MEGPKIYIKHEVNIPVRTHVILDIEVDIERKDLNHLYETVSLCGLVVRALIQNMRGIRFDPHWGLYTFQSYCLEMFKRVNLRYIFNNCMIFSYIICD